MTPSTDFYLICSTFWHSSEYSQAFVQNVVTCKQFQPLEACFSALTGQTRKIYVQAIFTPHSWDNSPSTLTSALWLHGFPLLLVDTQVSLGAAKVSSSAPLGGVLSGGPEAPCWRPKESPPKVPAGTRSWALSWPSALPSRAPCPALAHLPCFSSSECSVLSLQPTNGSSCFLYLVLFSVAFCRS